MNDFLSLLGNWLKAHSITSHTVMSVVTTLVLFYNFNTQFHDTVLQVYAYFPHWAKTVLELSVAFYMWYKNTHSQTDTSQAAAAGK